MIWKHILTITLWLIFLSHNVLSQESKRNNNWIISAADSPIKIRFDSFLCKQVNNLNVVPYPLFWDGSSCISNLQGELQFGCNGFYIYDDEGYCIDSTAIVNTPYGKKLFNYYGGVGFFNQMSIILPKTSNQYYVITGGMSDAAYEDWKVAQTDFRFDVLNYAVVDMDSNAGKGKVLSRNNIIKQNARLSHNRMTAVKHGNGKDWWLIKPHQWRQMYYLFKVTENGIYEMPPQDLNIDYANYAFNADFFTNGMAIGEGTWGIKGNMEASSNGEWIASTEASQMGVFVHKFDRCNGTLNFYHYYPINNIPDSTCFPTTWEASVGVCFSPNNKLLYLSTQVGIYQIDIEDTTSTSMVKISGIDTLCGYFPEFYKLALAPNGKIYVGAWHGIRKSMPTIDSPDVRGLGCSFKGRGNGAFTQPFTNLNGPPNMPNYGLGGNGLCWPTGQVAVEKKNRLLTIYPNPNSGLFYIESLMLEENNAQLQVLDFAGRVVQTLTLKKGHVKQQIQLPKLVTGVYLVQLNSNTSHEQTKLLIE